jgi:uncharacterized protein
LRNTSWTRDERGVELVQTDVSSLIFEGDLVHKRKKPVRLAVVDLSTPARRERVCQQEVELNRRFSPDIYLGLEEIATTRAGLWITRC